MAHALFLSLTTVAGMSSLVLTILAKLVDNVSIETLLPNWPGQLAELDKTGILLIEKRKRNYSA